MQNGQYTSDINPCEVSFEVSGTCLGHISPQNPKKILRPFK